MQGVFHEISKSSFNVFTLLLASAVWSQRTQFKEYPSPCRLTTLLQTSDLQGKSLTVCAAMCSQLSGCATFSYHGNSYICELADRDAFGDGCSDTAEIADDTIYSPCVSDDHCFEANTRCLQIQINQPFYCRCLAMFEYSAVSKRCERACDAYGTTWPASYYKIDDTYIYRWEYTRKKNTPPDACAVLCKQSNCESFCVRSSTHSNDPMCFITTISAPEANRSGDFRTDTDWDTYMRLCVPSDE